jgi:hypothetical protein
LARLATALLFTPQVDRRLTLSEEAVRLARRLGDPATLAAVLHDRLLVIWGTEQKVLAEGLAVATEVVELAERLGDRAMVLRGRGLRRSNLLELSDLAGFDADLAAAEQTAQELRQLHYHWQLPLARATRALLAGRFAEAEKQAVQGLAIGQRAGDQAVEIYYAGPVATLRFMQGRFGETVELFQDLATPLSSVPGVPDGPGRCARRGRPSSRGTCGGRAAGRRGPDSGARTTSLITRDSAPGPQGRPNRPPSIISPVVGR